MSCSKNALHFIKSSQVLLNPIVLLLLLLLPLMLVVLLHPSLFSCSCSGGRGGVCQFLASGSKALAFHGLEVKEVSADQGVSVSQDLRVKELKEETEEPEELFFHLDKACSGMLSALKTFTSSINLKRTSRTSRLSSSARVQFWPGLC